MAEWLQELDRWMRQYDLETDLAAVWVLALGFQVYAIVKFVSWFQIVNQHDRTAVGHNLKWQKLAEGVMGEAMSMLYSLTLFAYYTGHQFGVIERLALRLFVMAGILGAVLWGVRFTYSLAHENRATDTRQDRREVAQDERDDRQQLREDAFDGPTRSDL